MNEPRATRQLLLRFKAKHHEAVQTDCTGYPSDAKLKRVWEESDKAEADLLAALSSPLEKAEKYAKDNPLGGPAKMFEAIASRIRAGEDYYAVLDDYDLQHKSPPSANAPTTADAIIREYRGESQRGLVIVLADHARFLEADVARWKRMYECAQNANAYRQDALEKSPHSPAAAPEWQDTIRQAIEKIEKYAEAAGHAYQGGVPNQVLLPKLRALLASPQPQAETKK